MKPFMTTVRSASADAVTGERLTFDEPVLDTGYANKKQPCMKNSRNRLVKESTIVWMAEAAGYTLTKRDAGDSRNAEVVDGTDASVGGGEDSSGEAETGGSEAPKRRSNGPSKSKRG